MFRSRAFLRFPASSLLCGFIATVASAADPAPAEKRTPSYAATPGPIRLWENDAPGARGQRPQDTPTLTPFLPDAAKRTGGTILVLPGGAYTTLAEHEGTDYAEWLAEHGIAAYVLKYRLGSNGYRHPTMLNDAARALRLVRTFAKRDGLDPARVGIMGSSAGGHLASTLATHFDAGDPSAADPIDRESSRPDLAILCYPVISMGEFTHRGSRRLLLGDAPTPELLDHLSNELQVTTDTPPCFIWHTVADKTVAVENALLFATALQRHKVPFALHIYEKGAHGLGLGRSGRPAPPWADQLLHWLKDREFLPK